MPNPPQSLDLNYFLTLKGLRNKESLTKMGSRMKISHQAVKKRVNNLSEWGYVRKFAPKARGIKFYAELTGAGQEILRLWEEGKIKSSEVVTSPSQVRVTAPDKELRLRLHGLQIKYEFSTKLGPKEPTLLLNMKDYPVEIWDKLNNWVRADVHFQNFMGMVSPSSLILTGIEPDYVSPMADIEAREAEYLFKIQGAVEAIEAQLRTFLPKLRIKRRGKILIGKVIKREWAYEHHPIAEDENGKARDRIKIKDYEGHVRAITDRSKGFGELETVYAPMSTEDMKEVINFEKMLILKEFVPGEIVSNLESLVKISANNVTSITKTVEEQRLQNQFFKKHNALMEAITVLINELREERRQ